MPNPQASLIIDHIVTAGNDYTNGKPGARDALVDLSLALQTTLEIPSRFLQRTFWAEPAKLVICKIACDLQIFQHIRDAGEQGISAEELAAKTGATKELLERLMRHLVAMHIAAIRNGRLCSTPLSDGLAADMFQHSMLFCWDITVQNFLAFPSYFKSNGYTQPERTGQGPFQHAHKTSKPMWDYLVQPNLTYFDSFMAAYRSEHINWFHPGFYPAQERLIDDFEPNTSDAFFVDIGGSRGHDLTAFAQAFPQHPGRLVLQDLPHVIAGVIEEATENVKRTRANGNGNSNGNGDANNNGTDELGLPFDVLAYDFFKESQPVKHARAYYLHAVLHDWDDADGKRILDALYPAMKPGYSRLLINEIVLSADRPTYAGTCQDMMMLAHFGVRERTEVDWRNLLEASGYQLCNIYSYPDAAESVIEARVPEEAARAAAVVDDSVNGRN